MSHKLLFGLLIIIFIGIAVYEGLPQRFSEWYQSDQSFSSLLSQVRSQRGLPEPLRGPLGLEESHLTQNGVLLATNSHRTQNGLLPLSNDPLLARAAEIKLKDMFAQQYFEHDSPNGKKPADVISSTGYEYLVVGENLALGNYKNDSILVQAWMDSPGHRANILDKKFQEIGVAVGKGTFEGKEVWLAVQEFGTPLEACPKVSQSLQKQVDGNRVKIETKQADLNQRKDQLKRENYSSQSQYESAVNKYNQDVATLNSLIKSTKELVEQYNDQVNKFNQCLESNA